jgi:hypothetical protein
MKGDSLMRVKWAFALAVLVGLSLTATPAKANPLLVGDTGIAPDVFAGISGTVLASQTVSGSVTNGSNTLSVSVSEEVVRDSGTGHLDFLYTVTNTGSSGQDGVGRFTVNNFGSGALGTTGPWTLDAGYDSTTSGVVPNTQDRPGADSGTVVGWNFDPNFIPVGGVSRTLVIKTNADFYTAGSVAAIDGATVDLAGYQPTVAPEPSSMAIAGLGALGLIGYGIRRRRGV